MARILARIVPKAHGYVNRRCLENRWTCKRPLGSNPSPAAPPESLTTAEGLAGARRVDGHTQASGAPRRRPACGERAVGHRARGATVGAAIRRLPGRHPMTASPESRAGGETAGRLRDYAKRLGGTITVSITWITPFVARMLAVVTVALLLRVSFPSFSESEICSPSRAWTVPFCCATAIA